ncbi:MAG TPA: hypothetical protein VKR05_05320 [Candidatus Cybelea sp.]|nr:hypothetical protein [Candidatus Cybelea sp.]
MVPLALTPEGIELGGTRRGVGLALTGLFDWIDRTFPADDEHAFVASLRDIELLARIEWDAPLPERLDERNIVNLDDLPDDLTAALSRPPATLVQCAACRRLCVRDDFVWKEKQLCAWDYHAQVFGKRGPWRDGPYEERHFETLPSCAYVAPELLAELAVDVLMTIRELAGAQPAAIVNALLESDAGRPHMAVRTAAGITVLREANVAVNGVEG